MQYKAAVAADRCLHYSGKPIFRMTVAWTLSCVYVAAVRKKCSAHKLCSVPVAIYHFIALATARGLTTKNMSSGASEKRNCRI